MTPQDLSKATGARIDRAKEWLPFIIDAMKEFHIDTPQRQAMFLSQIGHESGFLRYTVEIWGPTEAQKRYEVRHDLGNTQIGDGFKYRGRGLIMTTGRANYKDTGDALGVDLIAQPELLGQPALAARSAAWFWSAHGLNEIADTGDFVLVTRRINGGTNGLLERLALYDAAQEVLG